MGTLIEIVLKGGNRPCKILTESDADKMSDKL